MHYDERQLLDIVLTVGQYTSCEALNAFGVERDDGVSGFHSSSRMTNLLSRCCAPRARTRSASPAIARDDRQCRRVEVALDLFDDAVVGPVATPAPRVGDEHAVVDSFGKVAERTTASTTAIDAPVRADKA